ncbi:transcriptional regulator Kaiso-like isoform X2 [Lissotriton helveticus]
MERRKLITATDPKYCGTLLSSLNEQRVQGIFCDVTVIVEDKKFRAHKNILSSASTYFHQQFSVACQVVELSFVRAEIFAEILSYIYSSKIVRIRSDMLQEVVRTGKLLGVQFLADLGAPLSQVKSMESFIKDHSVEFSPYEADEKDNGNEKPITTNIVPDKDIHINAVPVVPGAILSDKELKETKQLANSKDEGKDFEEDIIFCSEIVAPKPPVLNPEMAQQTTRLHPVALPEQKTSAYSNASASAQTELTSKGKTPSYIICSQLVPPKPCVLNNTAVATETAISNAIQLPKTSPSTSTNPQTPFNPKPNPLPFAPSEGDGPSQSNLSVDLSSQRSPQASLEKLGSIQSIFTDAAIPVKTISDTVTFLKQNVSASSSTSAETAFISKLTSPFISPSKGDKPSSPNVSVTFSPREAQGSIATLGSSQNLIIPNTVLLNQPLLNCPSITAFPQQLISPTINVVVQQVSSVNTLDNSHVAINNTCWPTSSYAVTSAHKNPVKEASDNGPKVQGPCVASYGLSGPMSLRNSNWPSSLYPLVSSFNQQGNRVKESSSDRQTVQKPQLASGELKIKVAAINSGSNKDFVSTGGGLQHIMDGKKIITLDTPSDLGGLSNDCKVYANIGEDTYDIVIPIKEELDEDEAVDLLRSIDGPPDSKHIKVKHEDHYELSIEGKVYYICIVCKRSYVCLRGLKRHFNCHSWEKKYHCHYCEKVFPLAEYRTKHELRHTRMKRYQCLTCGNYFIDYKVITTHMRSAHSQDPSKDTRLYRLHPAKPSQIKQEPDTINDHPSTSVPVVNDDIVRNTETVKQRSVSQAAESGSPSKPMSWHDVFTPQAELDGFKQNISDSSTEFEVIVPESY